MSAKKYVVRLSEAERAQLRTLSGRGAGPAHTLTHARILLKANQGEGGGRAGPTRRSPMRWRSGGPPSPACAGRRPPPGWTPR